MTEIPIMQMKSVRFDGEHCDYDCDFNEWDDSEGRVCTLRSQDDPEVLGWRRTNFCMNEFGEGE